MDYIILILPVKEDNSVNRSNELDISDSCLES
jgi:hypothetical protein